MRLVENRNGVCIIPKKRMKQATEKLARFEDGMEKVKAELLAYIDEVDGYIADDPVSLIREKVEELL